MEKMSRDRRKEKLRNLGSMRAANPMDDSADMAAETERAERAARAAREMPMTPSPDVEASAMEEVRRERERKRMGEAYDRSMRNYASGGYVKSADGCAQRGKTKGRIV